MLLLKIVFLLLFTSVHSAVIKSEKIKYSNGYEYLEKLDAFFKYHKYDWPEWPEEKMKATCTAEGAELYEPKAESEIILLIEMINKTEKCIFPERKRERDPCGFALFMCKSNTSTAILNEICETYDPKYKYQIDLDKCYKLHLKPETWREAFNACKREESQLAIINSDAEAQILIKEWAKHPDSELQGEFDKTVVYLGFNDLLTPGEHMTITGQRLSATGYEKWSSNIGVDVRAGGGGDGDKHCGGMERDGKLNVVKCDKPAMFFCEKSLTHYDTVVPEKNNPYSRPGAIVELPDA